MNIETLSLIFFGVLAVLSVVGCVLSFGSK